MTPPPHRSQRAILQHAVRNLVQTARLLGEGEPERSPLRQFYLGVESAGEELLHPELARCRAGEWLEHETSMFRDGYGQASDRLAAATVATAADRPPRRISVPQPPRRLRTGVAEDHASSP